MADIIIAEAVRSAVGKAVKGSLINTRPDDMAADVIRGLLERVPQVKPEMVDDVILGCAMPEGEQGLNVARIAALAAGIPQETSAMTINRFCSSGLQAIATAAGQIAFGGYDFVVAGGVESMSYVPMGGFHLSASPDVMDRMPTAHTPMGITAEVVAERFGITREEQDQFAYQSHMKACKAIADGKFKDEVVPIRAVKFENGKKVVYDFVDEELARPDTTLEGLAKLKPSFSAKGTCTPGNSSPLSDGAAASLVLSKAKADQLGIKGLAYLRNYVTVGVDPEIMGIAPIPAIRKLFAQTGLSFKDISVLEVNEAFASQSCYVKRELGIPDEILNVNGGAIALGHPLGCTGAKLTATALYELKRRGGKYAVVSMCIGGGQGAAALFEAI
jgi:acetyl-CoA acyltransferase